MYELTELVAGEILSLAKRDAPREVCGFIVRDSGAQRVVQARNVATDPEETFVVEPGAYSRAKDRGTIEALYHSHPDGTIALSPADEDAMHYSGLPWVVAVPESLQIRAYGPNTERRPGLWQRSWRLGFMDCLSFAVDYYHEVHGLDFAGFEVPENFPESCGPQYMLNEALERGFVLVDRDDMQPGDLMILTLVSKHPNHLAIVTRDYQMAHHMLDCLSRRETISAQYRGKRLAHLLRHTSFFDE